MLVFMIAFMGAASRGSWTMTLSVSQTLGALAYILFHKIPRIAWPRSFLGDWFPVLRYAKPIALF